MNSIVVDSRKSYQKLDSIHKSQMGKKKKKNAHSLIVEFHLLLIALPKKSKPQKRKTHKKQ